MKIGSTALLLCLPIIVWIVSGYKHEHLSTFVIFVWLMFFVFGLVNLVSIVRKKQT